MRTVVVLLPLALLLIAPVPLALVLRRRFLDNRGSFVLALLLAGLFTLAGARLLLPFTADSMRAAPRGDLGEADSFVVFAFGLGASEGTAGESNLALARWLLESNPHRKPTVVQEGVYLALRELNAPRLDEWVKCLPSPRGVYIDTVGGAFQADGVLGSKNLKRPVLVAHDLHLQRMAWTFEEIGRTEFIVPDMPPIPFDPNSSQHGGTKSEGGWLVREWFGARPVTLRPRWAVALLVGVAFLYAVVVWRVLRLAKVTYRNPVPVAAVLVPIDGGLLLVRRAIEPAKGQLTFPGGYVNEGESWQAAAARELLEETGIALDPSELELFDAISTRRGHLIILYAVARPRSRADLPAFTPTPEATELVVIDAPVSFAWEQDTRVAARYFADRSNPPQPRASQP